jgi:protein tyrosine phosphatase (PTP) superfamily phosphohydrolase (DUF442 family)
MLLRLSGTLLTLMIAIGVIAAAASSPGRQPPATQPVTETFPSLNEPALDNGHRVTARVLSGAQPEGEESFKALRALGVKTIISVDGAKPDVELARKHGLRYVHLPIGYDGVEPHEGQAIAKALKELPGPVYIHCHHGKHRSAAAVAVACVYAGELQPHQAEDVLRTFGTGANYTGLWQAARDARPLAPGVLESLKVDYAETAKVSDLADAMVRIDQHWEHLQQTQKAGWRSPADHPDLSPAHEALQVEEHFHEIGRTEQGKGYDVSFREVLTEAEASAKALREALAAQPLNRAAAEASMKAIAQSCTACHREHRD